MGDAALPAAGSERSVVLRGVDCGRCVHCVRVLRGVDCDRCCAHCVQGSRGVTVYVVRTVTATIYTVVYCALRPVSGVLNTLGQCFRHNFETNRNKNCFNLQSE